MRLKIKIYFSIEIVLFITRESKKNIGVRLLVRSVMKQRIQGFKRSSVGETKVVNFLIFFFYAYNQARRSPHFRNVSTITYFVIGTTYKVIRTSLDVKGLLPLMDTCNNIGTAGALPAFQKVAQTPFKVINV